MRLPKHLEAEILARADKVGPSVADPASSERLPTILGANGVWTFRVPNWHPAPVNRLYDHHWASRRKHKKTDAEVVAYYGRGVPKAVDRKRGVSMHVCFPRGKRMPDVDALWKSLLDSLVGCGILVNDSAAWASMNPVEYSRGESLVTFITVEDM